eukprot:gene17341-20683_t
MLTMPLGFKFALHQNSLLSVALCTEASSYISGQGFIDTNGNGEMNNNEPGLNGLVVEVSGANGVTTTVANPEFWIEVVPGYYCVKIVSPPGYRHTVIGAHNTFTDQNEQACYNLAVDNTIQAVYPGFVPIPFDITGRIFEDENNNGVFDSNEHVLTSPSVNLFRGTDVSSGGILIAQTPLAVDGTYAFLTNFAGPYCLQLVNSNTGYTITSTGADNVFDSNGVHCFTGVAGTNVLANGGYRFVVMEV